MNLETLAHAPPREGSCVTDSQNSPEQFPARRILIADDDACIRQLVSTALAGDGFDVSAAADGEQAWEALRHGQYDLLVTDNEMPRLKGIKLVERIRNEGMSLPVIIASGAFSVEKMRNAAQLHIAAVLPKPFDLLKLLDTVRHALQPAGESADSHGTRCQLHPSPPPVRQHN